MSPPCLLLPYTAMCVRTQSWENMSLMVARPASVLLCPGSFLLSLLYLTQADMSIPLHAHQKAAQASPAPVHTQVVCQVEPSEQLIRFPASVLAPWPLSNHI